VPKSDTILDKTQKINNDNNIKEVNYQTKKDNMDNVELLKLKHNSNSSEENSSQNINSPKFKKDTNVNDNKKPRIVGMPPVELVEDTYMERKKQFTQNYGIPIYYIFYKRNLYVSMMCEGSYLNPKFLKYNLIFFLIFFQLFICIVMMTFTNFDLFNTLPVNNMGKLTGIVFLSMASSNILYFLLSFLSKIEETKQDEIKEALFIEKNFVLVRNLITSHDNICVMKSIVIFLINLAVLISSFYLSFGFCLIWYQNWAQVIILLWFFSILLDFIIFEILLEFFVYILLKLKGITFFKLLLYFLNKTKLIRSLQ